MQRIDVLRRTHVPANSVKQWRANSFAFVIVSIFVFTCIAPSTPHICFMFYSMYNILPPKSKHFECFHQDEIMYYEIVYISFSSPLARYGKFTLCPDNLQALHVRCVQVRFWLLEHHQFPFRVRPTQMDRNHFLAMMECRISTRSKGKLMRFFSKTPRFGANSTRDVRKSDSRVFPRCCRLAPSLHQLDKAGMWETKTQSFYDSTYHWPSNANKLISKVHYGAVSFSFPSVVSKFPDSRCTTCAVPASVLPSWPAPNHVNPETKITLIYIASAIMNLICVARVYTRLFITR